MAQLSSSIHALPVPRRHWDARELVVLGVFAAAAKVSTLAVALAGGGLNPVSLMAKNLIFTTLLVVMLCKVRKPGTLTLFILVNVLISALLLGVSVTLVPSMFAGALLGELAMALAGGTGRSWAPVLGAAVYDLVSKVLSVGVSWLAMRENPAMLVMLIPIVGLGWLGSLGGLFTGVRAVRELRHAGIVRD